MCWLDSQQEIDDALKLIHWGARYYEDYLKRYVQGLGKATGMMTSLGLVREGALILLTLEGARKGSCYWDPEVRELCGEGRSLNESCILWWRDMTHSWQPLLGEAKEINMRTLCSCIPLISFQYPSFIESSPKPESKIFVVFLTGQAPRTQRKVGRMKSRSQEANGPFPA